MTREWDAPGADDFEDEYFDEDEFDGCECDGSGIIVVCPDDLCRASGGCNRPASCGGTRACPCGAF